MFKTIDRCHLLCYNGITVKKDITFLHMKGIFQMKRTFSKKNKATPPFGSYYELVEKILRENEEARKSDYVLVAEVIASLKPSCRKVSLIKALKNWSGYELPSFETISRTRREVQSDHPELKDMRTSIKRSERASTIRNYYIAKKYKY